MKVAKWRMKEVGALVRAKSIQAGQEIMDNVAAVAKTKCPVGTVTREPGYIKVIHLNFIPKRGRNKGKEVSFTARHWTGRSPGSLRRSIRRVDKPSRPGNIRVYAGHFKVPYAHFVEYGTVKMAPRPFMRNTFNSMKEHIRDRIEKAVAEELREQG